MTGLSSKEEFGKIRWADAELQNIAIDYDSVTLWVRESDRVVRSLRAEGYIGYRLLGFWDEVVIEGAELSFEHKGIEECLARIQGQLGKAWIDSGNLARNQRQWFALTVCMSDGAVLEVFAAQLSVGGEVQE